MTTQARPPGDLSHLRRLIDTWARSDTAPAGSVKRLNRLIAITALASIFDGLHRDGADHLAFKGGASMEFRFGAQARSSRDVDAVIDVTFDDAFTEISQRLTAGWHGFTGTLGERTEITRAGSNPAPQRCKIRLSYKAKAFATIDFEVGRAEADSFEFSEQITNVIDITPAQLPPPSDVTVLDVHYQIAQKLHACSEVYDEGANDRVHDLYDILLLADLARTDGLHHTRRAAETTFTHRNKHPWPPALTAWPDWPALWTALDIPAAAAFAYDDAVTQTTTLIADIAAARELG